MLPEQLINKGKVWIVYPDDDPVNILFEGATRAKAMIFIAEKCPTAYKQNKIRIGKIIWEQELKDEQP